MKANKIVKLSERDHILKRPSMYIGSIKSEVCSQYIYNEDKFIKKDIKRSPGLIKSVFEIIDNCIDEFIRTKGQFANKIDIEMDNCHYIVKDNGRGIPIEEVNLPTGEIILTPELAWTHARAGSNFDDNSQQIGANGVGSALTSIFSKKFIGITNDGKKCVQVITQNNQETINTEIIKNNKKQGTIVEVFPDFERLDEKEFNENYFDIIKTRLYLLSISYPEISFTFNKEKIKLSSKEFFKMFSDKEFTFINNKNYTIGITVSETDDFQQFTLMNGLCLTYGGTCVDYIANNVSSRIKDKLSKKYPNIKNADIKNKLFIISVLNNFTDPKYDSQTKEKLTNSQKEISDYFQIDLDNISNQVFKNKEIISNVTELFRIKEEFKKRQELKGLEKSIKKIKSEKYIEPIGNPEYLILCEGYSAISALSQCLGRKGIGYFELKGKCKNTCEETSITDNKELSELYKILKNTIQLEDVKDGDFYELEIEGRKIIVNENDYVTINNKEYDVKFLLNNDIKEFQDEW